jgi:excisionase family DNA binding protein
MSELENGPLLVDVKEAARLLGCGRTTLYALLARGVLTSVKIGGSRRVPAAAIRAYVDSLQRPVCPAHGAHPHRHGATCLDCPVCRG